MLRYTFSTLGFFSLVLLALDGSAQTSCETCSLSFIEESLDPAEIFCSDGDPLQALPNFPAFNTTCTDGYWASIFKYTTGTSSTCSAARPVGLPAALGTVQLGEFASTGLVSSGHFNDLGEALTWSVYPENVARLQGTVYNNSDVSAFFDVDFYFSQSVSGADWISEGGNVNDAAALPGDPETWSIWQLRPNISKLVGRGLLEGEIVYLSTSNSPQSYPFQVGVGANGVNLEQGIGGSFDWSACVNETIYGGLGTCAMEFVSCEETTSICASDNDAVVEFFIGNIRGFDQIQGSADITDDSPPILVNVPNNYTLNCPIELEELDALNAITALDECSDVSLSMTETFTNGDCPSEFTRTRVYTATDGCGLTDQHTQIVQVIDEVSPVLSVPSDATFDCDVGPTFAPATAVDACDGNLEVIEGNQITVEGSCPGEYTIHRTFSTSDLCGNEATGAQTIFVQDQTPPTLVTPADVILPCGSNFVYPTATATDNCTSDDDISLNVFNSLPQTTCPEEYVMERSFFASDLCGNTVLEIQTVTVTDNDLPYFTFVPEDATYGCEETPIFEEATAEDSCSTVEMTASIDTVFFESASDYDLIRTFIVTDACGNMADAQQIISVRDIEAPEFTFVPADYITECSEDLILEDATASDICSELTIEISNEILEGVSAGNYTVVRTFTATDDAGNSTSAQQTITVQDTTSPEFTSVPSDYTSECSDDLILDDATASDNCGEVTIDVSSETIAGDAAGNYTVVRTFTATDDAGNSTSAQQTITVQDTTAPEFIFVPSDDVVECTEEWPEEMATASDNCGIVTIEVSADTTFTECGLIAIERTFTATDDANNATQVVQILTQVDTQGPAFTNLVANVTLSCSESLSQIPIPTAIDLCSEITNLSWTDVEFSGGCTLPTSAFIRTYTAEDACNNVSQTEQIIVLIDQEAPSWLSLPEDVTIECTEDYELIPPTAIDNCALPQVSWEVDTIGEVNTGAYDLVFDFSAVDDCGNLTQHEHVVHVEDTVSPDWVTFPANHVMSCDETLDDSMPTATACSELVTVTLVSEVFSAGNCEGSGIWTRSFSATDWSGNDIEASQYIEVIDTVAPSFTFVPGPAIWECNAPVELDSVVVVDACSNVTLTASIDTIGSLGANQWELLVTWTAEDGCGNLALETQGIAVIDQIPPSIEQGPGPAVLAWGEALPLDVWENELIFSDICSDFGDLVTSVTVDTLEATQPCIDELLLTWTVTDLVGNQENWVQNVSLYDNDAPQWSNGPIDLVIPCDSILEPVPPSWNDHNAYSIDQTLDTLVGSCPSELIVTLTFVAEDVCGNVSDAWIQNINVVDTISPTIESWPSDLVVNAPLDVPSCELESILWIDACNDAQVTCLTDTLEQYCPGSFLLGRTYIVADDCGNTSSVQQNILVEDIEAPAFVNWVSAETFSCDSMLEAPQAEDLTFIDNQSTIADIQVVGILSEVLGDVCALTEVYTYTLTDGCGNVSDNFTLEWTFVDEAAPSLVQELDSLEFYCVSEIPPFDEATVINNAIDNCGTVSASASDEFEGGECTTPDCLLIRTITLSDNCGNTSTVEQIMVISEPPTVPELPTGFSPNNDSFNDVYQIRNAGPDLGIPPCDWLTNTAFTVFDRWGSLVFQSNDISESWDGTNLNGRPLPTGSYFVVFEANGLTYRQTVDLRR